MVNSPRSRARLTQAVSHAFDRKELEDLLEERALAHDAMDASRVRRVREDMERAEARKLTAALYRVVFSGSL